MTEIRGRLEGRSDGSSERPGSQRGTGAIAISESMSGITTHVLDTSRGRPASGVPVLLEVRAESGEWRSVGKASTDADGRARLLSAPNAPRGFYRVTFDTSAYFRAWNVEGFYPEVQVHFEVRDPGQHYHVPLLLSPHGYSTYRGS